MTNSTESERYSKSRDLGKRFAAEIKKPPRNISFIEARGYLCHELIYLLGGCVTFTETPIRNFVVKALEYFLPIAPICRWFPPPNSSLEQIGYHSDQETSVYRFKPENDTTVVFFVQYKPDPPAFGPYVRSLFNAPQLDLDKFLCPPFRCGHWRVLRRGMVGEFTPIPMTDGARESVRARGIELDKAMWEEFCRD